MKKYNLSEIRKMWIDFFVEKKHYHFPTQSLIPKDDDSLLWVNSGVAVLKKYFLGIAEPPSTSLVNSQKCIRTNDIENVGVTSRHHTFFEMLGNFSIGGYFRKEAIELAFEFLTTKLKLEKEKLYITVFCEDDESFDKWLSLGIKKENIVKADRTRNFWEIGVGPSGPCTEIFYDRGVKFDPNKIGKKLFLEDIENDRFVEIWNIVFSEFESLGNQEYKPLKRKNIDTGAGLERLACILQDVPTNYDIDSFMSAKKQIEKFSSYKYNVDLYFEEKKDPLNVFVNKSFNVIVDHFRACIHAISDGALPSNKGKGYIIRKLLRRSFFLANFLNAQDGSFIEPLVNDISQSMGDFYPDLKTNSKVVTDIIMQELSFYQKSISNSIKHLNDLIIENKLNSKTLFKLVDTYGFPVEIINEIEMIESKNVIELIFKSLNISTKVNVFDKTKIDFKAFNVLLEKHKEISKSKNVASGFVNQSVGTIDIDIESEFDYDKNELDSKVIKIFNTDVEEVESITGEDCYVIFDNTVFYATSGGQINDLGFVDKFEVVDVLKIAKGQHLHLVKNASLKLNQKVHLKIDTHRRALLSKNHSVEHLIHSALKKHISESLKQEGAYKSPEKVTFDFNYHKKLSIKEIETIENQIKDWIHESIQNKIHLKTIDEATAMGALAYFENVYKKIVGKLRVIQMGDASIEICGGTHVSNTKDIEDFKIIKLESKGSGSWRIEAITSHETIKHFYESSYNEILKKFKEYHQTYKEIGIKDDEIEEIFKTDLETKHFIEIKEIYDILFNKMNILKAKNSKNQNANESENLRKELESYNDYTNLIFLDGKDGKIVFYGISQLLNQAKENIFAVLNFRETLYQYYICCNENFAKEKNIDLKKIANIVNKELNGKGGGKPNFVQGSFTEMNKDVITKSFEKAFKEI